MGLRKAKTSEILLEIVSKFGKNVDEIATENTSNVRRKRRRRVNEMVLFKITTWKELPHVAVAGEHERLTVARTMWEAAPHVALPSCNDMLLR